VRLDDTGKPIKVCFEQVRERKKEGIMKRKEKGKLGKMIVKRKKRKFNFKVIKSLISPHPFSQSPSSPPTSCLLSFPFFFFSSATARAQAQGQGRGWRVGPWLRDHCAPSGRRSLLSAPARRLSFPRPPACRMLKAKKKEKKEEEDLPSTPGTENSESEKEEKKEKEIKKEK
jgi:hypothetical protein